MTTREKISLLQGYDDLAVLSSEHFINLKNLSYDNDTLVRSMVASLLVDFINEESKSILQRLAQDKDELVRTEALDSSSVFPFHDVVEFLEKAILSETNGLARSYAILSWTDVLLLLKGVTDEKVGFARQKRETEKSTKCALSWCYALFMFGNDIFLNEMLQFLKNDDYQIRCETLALLGDIINPNNEEQIKEAIKLLLVIENTKSVRDRAERFLEEKQLPS